MKREFVEVVVFILLIVVYVAFHHYIAGKALFVIPTVLISLGYILNSARSDPNLLREYGVRFDNFYPASKRALILFIPIFLATLLWAFKRGWQSPPASFYYVVLLYPIWGIAQQFLFQSFFHTRLIRLGLAPWSILIVALAFATVHLPSINQIALSFFGGLLYSYIFLKHPNIIPLGIAHGLFAAVWYYFILGKDVFDLFLT